MHLILAVETEFRVYISWYNESGNELSAEKKEHSNNRSWFQVARQ